MTRAQMLMALALTAAGAGGARAQEEYGSTRDAEARAARAAAAEDGVAVAAMGATFCDVYPDIRGGGLPGPEPRMRLEPLLTLAFDGALDAAGHLRDRAIRHALVTNRLSWMAICSQACSKAPPTVRRVP
ncbi:hypothetical protein ACFQ4K_27150 [Tistrella bauzanensis]